jgi:hypothetical protein
MQEPTTDWDAIDEEEAAQRRKQADADAADPVMQKRLADKKAAEIAREIAAGARDAAGNWIEADEVESDEDEGEDDE